MTVAQPRLLPADALRGVYFIFVVTALLLTMLWDRNLSLILIAVLAAPFVVFHPKTGFWLAIGLMMAASMIDPPAGFEFGIGYSPELPYWASALCILLVASTWAYLSETGTSDLNSQTCPAVSPSKALHAYAAVCVFATVLGIMRGYPLHNVGKQAFGCLLFCAYFVFALKFTPTAEDISEVTDWAKQAGIVCALVYIAIYLAQVPTKGLRKELTILAGYGGGLAVLYLPELLRRGRIRHRFRSAIPMAVLFLVPLLAQYKRAILAFTICGFLAIGLRSLSRTRRYLHVSLAFGLFALVLSTNVLNPIGRYFSRYESLKYLFPEDIQTSYSLVGRISELTQILDTLGGAPVVGTGLGSTVVWFEPYTRTWWEQETVEIGWGYVLVKAGIVGTVVFLWFIATLLRDSLRRPLHGLHLGMFLLFIFMLLQMVADPFFFNFMTSAWAGMTCGFLHVLNREAAPVLAEGVDS